MAHQLPHVSLQKEDWYFSRCPKDEIFDCWVYEFAREYFLRRKTVPEACHMFFPLSDALKRLADQSKKGRQPLHGALHPPEAPHPLFHARPSPPTAPQPAPRLPPHPAP